MRVSRLPTGHAASELARRAGKHVGRRTVERHARGAVERGLVRQRGLLPALDKVSISLRDVVAAVVGSLIVRFAGWFWQRQTH